MTLPQQHPLHILFVGDKVSAGTLATAELHVTPVSTVQEAAERAASNQPDVFLLEYRTAADLPAVSDLTSAFPDLPLILLMRGEDVAAEQKAFERGAEDVVQFQTITSRALERLARRAIERTRMRTAQRRATRILRENEARLRLLVEQLPGILWTTDRELRITSSAGAGLAALGAPPDRSAPVSVSDYLRTDDPENPVIRAHRLALDGVASDFEITLMNHTFHSHVEPLHDSTGRRVGVIGIAIDITERKESEARISVRSTVTRLLSESQDVNTALRSITQLLCEEVGWCAAIYWQRDPATGELRYGTGWSTPAAHSFDKFSKDLTFAPGQSLPGTVAQSGGPVWIWNVGEDTNFRRAEAARASGIQSGFAVPVVSGPNLLGVIEFFSASATPPPQELLNMMSDMGHQIAQFIERIRAQETLLQSERTLRRTQEIARLGGFDLHILENRITWSDEMFRIFSFPPPEAPSMSVWMDRIPEDQREHVKQALDQAYVNGQPFRLEHDVENPSGPPRRVEFRGEVATGPDGTAQRIFGTVQDITERTSLQTELDRAIRVAALGRVAATIAHEFNNVLMGIGPFADLLERTLDDPKARQAVNHIKQSILRGKRVTDEIRRFAQPAQPRLEAIELHRWVNGILPELRALAGLLVDLQVELPEEEVYVEGDVHQLNQVLTNLVANARDAMPNGGTITLEARVCQSADVFQFASIPSADRYVELQVRDTGIGMNAETLRHIFEPMFTTKSSGTGLGLAVAEQVVRRHGGEIYAQSEPGRGTTFHLFLRAALPPSDAQGVPVSAPLQQRVRPRRVLVVEDEPLVAEGVTSLLEMEGFDTFAVSTGADTLPAIRDFRPDVVVLDVGLPDMSGVDVYKTIAAEHPDLPVIFSTGHADEGRIGTLLQSDIQLIQKPYDIDSLLNLMARVMRNDAPTS